MTEQEKEKAAFFEQYASVADEKALEMIWEAKQSQATYLDLDDEKSLKDLSPLQDLVQLETLYISNTKVSDLNPLKHLVQMKELFVYENEISDLSPLKDLVRLQVLSIIGTQIIDLSPLKDLVQLQYLWISNTQVRDLSPLKDLVQLEVLYVSNTQVSDLSPLRGLIEKGIEVNWENKDGIYIKDTPLSNPPVEIAKQGNKAILCYWEEQERLNFTHP